MGKTFWKNKARVLKQIGRVAPAVVEETRKALATGAQDIVNMQRRLVRKKTGKLSRSIRWQYGDAQRVAYSQGGKSVQGRLSVRISAGASDVRYAHLVEFGAAAHEAGGIFKGAQHPGAPAQPFFYPAYRAKRKAFKARVARGMRKGARLAVKGG